MASPSAPRLSKGTADAPICLSSDDEDEPIPIPPRLPNARQVVDLNTPSPPPSVRTQPGPSVAAVVAGPPQPRQNTTEPPKQDLKQSPKPPNKVQSHPMNQRDSPTPNIKMSPHPSAKKSSDKASFQDGQHSSQKPVENMTSSPVLLERLRQQRIEKASQPEPGHRRSESPRAAMARRSMAVNPEPPQTQTHVEDIEECLNLFKQQMSEDFALSTRWLLHDQKEASMSREPLFMEDASPFGSLDPSNLKPGRTGPGSKNVEKIESLNAKGLKTKTTLIAKQLHVDDSPRVPKYYSFTNVRRNILIQDDDILKHIPTLSDENGDAKQRTHEQLRKDLLQLHESDMNLTLDEKELAYRIRLYLDDWLTEIGLFTQDALKQRILAYDVARDELRIKRGDRDILLSTYYQQLTDDVEEAVDSFVEAFERIFDLELEEVLFPSHRVKDMVSSAGALSQKSPQKPGNPTSSRLSTYASQTCLICGAWECQTHGEYFRRKLANNELSDDDDDVKKYSFEYLHRSMALDSVDLIRKYKVWKSKKRSRHDIQVVDDDPCSPDCHKIAANSQKSFPILSIEGLSEILLTNTDKNYRACHISFFKNLPCEQVHRAITAHEEQHVIITFPAPMINMTQRPSWYDNRRKVLKGDWRASTTLHLMEQRNQTLPCAHDGPCNAVKDTEHCHCAGLNLLCERFCGCPDDCPRKFTGCSCSSSGLACVSDTCLCIQMNRECGPECTSCGAVPRINPENKFNDDLFSKGCQNVFIQRGVAKKSMIGESQLEGVGFGLYLGEPVHKGDFISEYAGEVISSIEGDRRGVIYDRKMVSFLFDLNSDWVIDAARFGNKTRFINHADNAALGLNCVAKILLVNGEHRIKFIATRDIQIGEELLFDYGKKFRQNLSKTMAPPGAGAGHKKGVVLDLDALDGIDQRKKESRGKMTAIRGGHSRRARGSRTANTKTAPTSKAAFMKPLANHGDDEDEEMEDDEMEDNDDTFHAPADDEEEDEEEEEHDVNNSLLTGPGGRKKRRAQRPMRYTR